MLTSDRLHTGSTIPTITTQITGSEWLGKWMRMKSQMIPKVIWWPILLFSISIHHGYATLMQL